MTFNKHKQFNQKRTENTFYTGPPEELYRQIGNGNVSIDQDAVTPEGFVAHKTIEVEKDIRCSNCDKHLMTVIVVDKTKPSQKLKVHCPCGDHSFIYNVTGKAFQDPGPGLEISETEQKDGILEVYMV